MTSTQGLDIQKGQNAGRFVKFEAGNVAYRACQLDTPLVLGTKLVARMGWRALTFYDLAKDTGCYRGHGSRKGNLDEFEAYYQCELTFGGSHDQAY